MHKVLGDADARREGFDVRDVDAHAPNNKEPSTLSGAYAYAPGGALLASVVSGGRLSVIARASSTTWGSRKSCPFSRLPVERSSHRSLSATTLPSDLTVVDGDAKV